MVAIISAPTVVGGLGAGVPALGVCTLNRWHYLEKQGGMVKLEALVAETLGVPESVLDEHSGPTTLTAWTSLAHMKLIVALEEMHGLAFSIEELRSLKCLGDIRHLLTDKGVA